MRNRYIAAAMLLFAVEMRSTPADACGVKLTVKAPVPKRIAHMPVAPIHTNERPVVAARSARTPIASGPTRRIVAAPAEVVENKPVEPPVAPKVVEPVPEPKAIEAAKPAEPKPEVVKPMPTPTPKAVVPTAFPRAEGYFGLNSTAVDGQTKKSLDKVGQWLTANGAAAVVIEGYADPSGNHDDNMKLSQARAKSARDYLLAMGIDASRIEVASFGDTKLKYGAGDGRNRRISVVVKP